MLLDDIIREELKLLKVSIILDLLNFQKLLKMHKHLFQECNKTSNCASSRIACRNKDLFSPNPVKASQLQVTTENFGSQNKKNQYRLNSKNK